MKLRFYLPLMVFGALLLSAVPAFAQTPVNPTTVSFDEPQTSADGTVLTDLAGHMVQTAAVAAGPWTNRKTEPASAANPAVGSRVTVAFSAFTAPITTDGAYLLRIVSFDTAGNNSAPSASVPFDVNRSAPSAATNLRVE